MRFREAVSHKKINLDTAYFHKQGRNGIGLII